eukprot:gb/GECH01009942.1/.p1 GENE.gb/GECH01009942.1/~~gb/GECH01009942.1/.p1  ORF type:complete len:727 (+),score=159.16 gb/GECH01009942.1/:1-2181(+)
MNRDFQETEFDTFGKNFTIKIQLNDGAKWHSTETYESLIKEEYPVRVLESIGVSPSAKNIQYIQRTMPLRNCTITPHLKQKGSDESSYIEIKPNILGESSNKHEKLKNRNLYSHHNTLVSKQPQFSIEEVQWMLGGSNIDDIIQSRTEKTTNSNSTSPTSLLTNPVKQRDNNKNATRNETKKNGLQHRSMREYQNKPNTRGTPDSLYYERNPRIESFDQYKSKYLYPFNESNKIINEKYKQNWLRQNMHKVLDRYEKIEKLIEKKQQGLLPKYLYTQGNEYNENSESEFGSSPRSISPSRKSRSSSPENSLKKKNLEMEPDEYNYDELYGEMVESEGSDSPRTPTPETPRNFKKLERDRAHMMRSLWRVRRQQYSGSLSGSNSSQVLSSKNKENEIRKLQSHLSVLSVRDLSSFVGKEEEEDNSEQNEHKQKKSSKSKKNTNNQSIAENFLQSQERSHLAPSELEKKMTEELSSPPNLSINIVLEILSSFVKNFPFEIWTRETNKNIKFDTMQKIKDRSLAEFILHLAELLYYSYLMSIKAKENYDKESNFLRLYNDFYEKIIRNCKSNTFDLPMILLCIRISVETIYRTSYPTWWKSGNSEQIMELVNTFIDAIFDPYNFHSSMAPIESQKTSREILNRAKKLKLSHRDRYNMMSPMITYLLRDCVSDNRVRNLISKSDDTRQESYIKVFKAMNPNIKTKLLECFMRRKKERSKYWQKLHEKESL